MKLNLCQKTCKHIPLEPVERSLSKKRSNELIVRVLAEELEAIGITDA